jgi:cytochrome c peroxidase
VRGALALSWLAAGALIGLPACSEPLVDGMFTEAEWETISHFSPLLPPPASPTNRFADRRDVADFGQRLWFEKHYAGEIYEGTPEEGGLGNKFDTEKVSCADCHDPKRWFTDTRSSPNSTSLGTGRTRRNAPSIVNVVFYKWGNWAGANDQFWKQGALLPEARDVFNSDRLRFVHVIYKYYRDDYARLFEALPGALDPAAPDHMRFPPAGKPGDLAWEMMDGTDRTLVNTIIANCGKAIEAYERLLVSGDAPLDRYVAGAFDELSTSAKRGLKLFIGKAGCVSCHKDETFTDQDFHNTGVTQSEPFDDGRFSDVLRLDSPFNGMGEFSDDKMAGQAKLDGIVQVPSMTGQFRTKSLRHIAETGPYFHNGSALELPDVVRFYNEGGGAAGTYPGEKDARITPLNLSQSEIDDLVAFLHSLTGQPVPSDLTEDTAARAPVSP